MKSILKALNERPIGYYPIYHRLTGSIHGAVLLSQLMYWLSKKDKIYKTNADIQSEIGFSERELKTAKNALKNIDFIIMSKEGIPAKTYYMIDWDGYEKALMSVQTSQDETVLTGGDETVRTGGDGFVPSINDQTFETTTETTTEKKKEEDADASSSSSSSTASASFASDGMFNAVYAELRAANDRSRKYLGSKQNTYEAYATVKDFVDIRTLAVAYRSYLSDLADGDNVVGLATFIAEDIYIGYLPKRMTLTVRGDKIAGVRSGDDFNADDGRTFQFTDSRFVELLQSGEIEFGVTS